ncbi:D5 family helicase-primase [Faustovirus]|nr:D5 family helicase-primase [Faustovirus]QJX74010.1 hypothetical protein F-E9_256 [Faustovirus]
MSFWFNTSYDKVDANGTSLQNAGKTDPYGLMQLRNTPVVVDEKQKYILDTNALADSYLPVDITGELIVDRPRIIAQYIADVDAKLDSYLGWYFHKAELNQLKGKFMALQKAYNDAIIALANKQPKTRTGAPKPAAKKPTKAAYKKAAAPKQAKVKLSASLRKTVWLTYIGDVETGKCLCCNVAVLTKNGYDCGHVVAEARGGPATLQNLRPICKTCNTSMGTKNMEEFMRECGYAKSAAWFEKMDIE